MNLNPASPVVNSVSTFATYSPEDNKLRLYVGRVPRDEYEKLRAEGWTSTPKQSCDFVATWTPTRRNTALEYGDGFIDDEDQSPAERAADRAERFSGYRDKRTDEATDHADRYDNRPAAHGYQSQAKSDRAAARHDRIGTRATDAWGKAEYWQRRTAGVISHALHKSRPDVRMGRIKVLEAEQRKHRASLDEYSTLWAAWVKLAAIQDQAEQTEKVRRFVGSVSMWSEYMHPRAEQQANEYRRTNKLSLYSLMDEGEGKDPITGAEAVALFFSNHPEPKTEDSWSQHYELRLAYENQMLEAQGGRAAFVEMQAGGWVGDRQIWKVNKSNVTGRVVSVTLKIKGDRWGNTQEGFHMRPFNIERLPADVYTAPTAADLQALAEEQGKDKAASTKTPCPLINPTDADAERLQALWNEGQKNPSLVVRMTQAAFSARLGHVAKIVIVCETGKEHRTRYAQNITRADVFKVRQCSNGEFYGPDRVVIITDKPQKSIPWDAIAAARAKYPTAETMRDKLPAIENLLKRNWPGEECELLNDAVYVGWMRVDSLSQACWTDAGREVLERYQSETANTAPALQTA